ncbi:MAG: hypothetical protein PUE12_17765 [Oscillospiraceae bacterium]|nr:hypothetical protein [Oscillospiraceae bacterium]
MTMELDIVLTILSTRIEAARQSGNTTEWYAMSLIKDEYQRLKTENTQYKMWISEYSRMADEWVEERQKLEQKIYETDITKKEGEITNEETD